MIKAGMKIHTILVLLFAASTVSAQHFSWTSTIVNTGLEFTMHSMCTSRQELCVGGHADQLSYSIGESGMYDTKGQTTMNGYEAGEAGDHMFVYDFSGKLKWHYFFYSEEATLHNFTYTSRGTLVAIVYKNGNDPDEYDEEEQEDDQPEHKPKDNEIPFEQYTGYCLYYFDQNGNVDYRMRIANVGDLEITDFQSHPTGGFVAAGHVDEGKVANNLSVSAGPAGCDFILFIDSTGVVKWGDALSYQKESCCTYAGEPKIAIDETGTIFLAGTYVGGARFGGKTIRLAPVPYNAGKYYTAAEAYVAAYSAKGEFQWVNTAGVQSYCTGVAAGQGYVYVGTSASRTGKLYGQAVDTSAHEHVFVTAFDKKGKFKNNISTGSGGKLDLSTDTKGNLVVTGTIGIETGFLQRPDSLDKKAYRREDCFVAFYSPGGKLQKHYEVDMLKIPNDPPPMCLAVDPQNFFLTGNLWGALSIPLRALDKGFPDIKFSAGAPFVGRCSSSK